MDFTAFCFNLLSLICGEHFSINYIWINRQTDTPKMSIEAYNELNRTLPV